MFNEYGAVYGMESERGNRNTLGKFSPILHCPPKIPHTAF
jgi:hypothetical protein